MKKLMYFLVFFTGMAFCQAQNYYSFNWTYTPATFASNDAQVRISLENGGQQTVFISFQNPNSSRKILNLSSKISSATVTVNFQPQQGPGCTSNENYIAGDCGVSFTQACANNIPSGSPAATIFGDFRLIEIASQGLETTSGNDCEEIEIPIVAQCANNRDLVVEDWFYRLPNQGLTWNLLPGHSGERTLRFMADEFLALGNNPEDYLNQTSIIELKPEFELYPDSEVIPYGIVIRPCPPNLIGNPITEDATCNGGEGTVTLRFDSNTYNSGQYQMRYAVYDSSVDLTGFDPDTDNPPSAAEEEILSLTAVGDGSGDYLGQLPVGLEDGSYKIWYQEFFDPQNGTGITLNGGAISQDFTILEPTEIIASATFQQASCSGDSDEITFSARDGDDLNPGGSYSFEYLIVGSGDGWTDAMDNPMEILPTTSAQTIQIRATYDNGTADINDDCLSAVTTYPDAIDVAIPALQFSNTTGGSASSTTSTEGVVSTDYMGGSAPYTFELLKENENTGALETVTNPTSIEGLNSIEFTGLGIGTYRITVIADGCPFTTGDIEVIGSPTPQLGTPQIVNEIFCAGGSDGTVSVTVAGSANPFQYEYRLLDSGGVELRRVNDNNPNLTLTDLSSGTYTLEVIFDTGDFGPPATGVASVPININNPNPLTFTVVDVVALDCNGTSDGYIEIQVSEAGDFEYTHRDLNTWIDLEANRRIPATQSGDYNDLIIRKEPRPGDTVFCTSNEIDGVDVPGAISIIEVLTGHQNVTTTNGTDGAIEIIVSGGNSGYSFNWAGTLLNGGSYTNNSDQNIQNLSAGDYTVTVTDQKGCMETLGPIQITQPGALSIDLPLTGTDTCNGSNTGTMTATVQGTGDIIFEFQQPLGNTVYTITTANRTVTAPNLGAGSYALRIEEVVGGNSVTTLPADYFTITELTPVDAIVTPTDATCAAPNSGSITITGVTGGSNSGYTYAIDSALPQAVNTFSNLTAGDYLITVIDDLGCEYSETATIGAGELPIVDTANSGPTSPSTIGGSDGFINLNFENADISGFSYQWNGPGTTNVATQNLINIEAGNYSVVITGGPGCSITENFTVNPPVPQGITPTITNIGCKGDATGAIDVAIVGEIPNSYQWTFADDSAITTSNGTTSEDMSGLLAGTYVLTITYVDTSTFRSGDIEITEPAAEITADINTTPSCTVNGTGTIVISNVQGGEPGNPQNYTYSIDGINFQDELLFENQTAATYSVWVRDGNNCDRIYSGITIAPSPDIIWDEANTGATNATAQGANDGTITLAFTSDATNYTYQWNGPGTVNEVSQNLTGKAAGVYTVVVMNENMCTLERTFTIAEPGLLTITPNTTKDPCFGENNGSIEMTVVGTGNLSLQWSEAILGDLIGETDQDLNNVPQGTYTLTVTDDAVNPPNVVSSNPITLSDPAAILDAQATPTDAQCAGVTDGSVTIIASGGIPPYEYSIDSGINYQTQATFNGLGSGTYSIRVRDSNDCVADDGFTINEPPAITFSSVATPLSAAGSADGAIDIAAVGGTGNLRFSWVGPAGFIPTTDEDISGLTAGDYMVTVQDENDCSFISEVITIDEPGAIIIMLTLNEEILCNGDEFGEILANVQGGVPDYTYQWFQEGNNTPLDETSNMLSNIGAGSYFLRVTDANSVSRDSNVLVVNEPNSLVMTLQNKVDIVCSGEASGSININIEGGTLPYVFLWNNGATSQNLTNVEAGDYSVEVFDDNGCSDILDITINPAPDALQLDAAITNVSEYLANDGSIALNVTGGATPYTINWTRDSDNTPTGNTANITALSADSYTVFVSDANGCATMETYMVTQPDIVEDTIVQPSCQGDTNGSISVLVNQGNGSFTYLWSTGETTNAITNLGAGDYTVTITGFGDGPVMRTYTLEDPLPLVVDLGQDRVLCVDQILELDATVEDETATYTWTSDTGFTSSNPEVTLTTTGNYTVTVQTAAGCTAVGTLFLEVSTDEIDAEFAVSSQVFTGDVLVAVDISFPLPDTIEWQVPEGATVVKQDSDEVELIFNQAGEYEITIVTARGDCIAQKTKTILVLAKDGSVNEDDDPRKLVEDFIVYPNPTTGRFTADVSLTERGNISIKVFNFANNALMASERGTGSTSYSIPFDISGMPSGVYAVLLETPYGTSLQKIIVR